MGIRATRTPLRRARQAEGITVRELSDITGINYQALLKLDHGGVVRDRKHARILIEWFQAQGSNTLTLLDIYDPNHTEYMRVQECQEAATA